MENQVEVGAGVDLARRIGENCAPFARVVASVVPRARETALAMGFAVDQELVTLLAGDDGAYDEIGAFDWSSGLSGVRMSRHIAATECAYLA